MIWDCSQLPSISGRHDGRKILLRAAVLGVRNPSDLSFLEVSALLDTGATGGAISPKIVQHFALEPYEKRYLKVATEDRLARYYFYRIGLFPDTEPGVSAPSPLPFVFLAISSPVKWCWL